MRGQFAHVCLDERREVRGLLAAVAVASALEVRKSMANELKNRVKFEIKLRSFSRLFGECGTSGPRAAVFGNEEVRWG